MTFARHLIRRSLRHQFLPPPIRIYLPYSSKRCKVKIHKSTWRFYEAAALVTLKYSTWIRSISRVGRKTVILTSEEAQGYLYQGLVFSSWLNCSNAQISVWLLHTEPMASPVSPDAPSPASELICFN